MRHIRFASLCGVKFCDIYSAKCSWHFFLGATLICLQYIYIYLVCIAGNALAVYEFIDIHYCFRCSNIPNSVGDHVYFNFVTVV